MKSELKAGRRVLYKDHNSGWMIGIIDVGEATVDEKGVWIPIIPQEFFHLDPADIPYVHYAELNNIFDDALKYEQWIKNYATNFMTKEDYIKFIESEDFDKRLENAYVADEEYTYYKVTTYTKSWLEKQPFKYIVRYDA